MSDTDGLITDFLRNYYSKADGVEKADITVTHNIYKETTGIQIIITVKDRDAFEAMKLEEMLVHNQTMEESMKEIYEVSHLSFKYEIIFK